MLLRTKRTIVVTIVAFFALAGTAYALGIAPDGGPPGSGYQVTVDCATEPTVRVFPLQAMPQMTVPSEQGTESAPGTWVFDLEAGNVDELVTSSCNGTQDQQRYDVDAPALFPGPTVAYLGDFDLATSGTSVVGTDCPAGTEASLTISGPGGYTHAATAPIDRYGNWQVPVPDEAPQGRLHAEAHCGSLTFTPLEFRHPSTSASTPTTLPAGSDTTTSGNPTENPPAAATPVDSTPTYTG